MHSSFMDLERNRIKKLSTAVITIEYYSISMFMDLMFLYLLLCHGFIVAFVAFVFFDAKATILVNGK